MSSAAEARPPTTPSSVAAPSRPNLDTSPYRLEDDLLEQCRTIDALLRLAIKLPDDGGPVLPTHIGAGLIAYYKAIADTMVRL